jgi:starch synthase
MTIYGNWVRQMGKLFAVVDATFKESLDQLTMHRMPGALPFAGKFRLIDFTLSNMRNSNITNVAIFPYGNYRSLQDHVGSGKRWDLDRRTDGLFILPPKNLYIIPSESITFQRMYEHIEYFRRSSQEYVVITATNIVWNIQFEHVLAYHLKKQADITEVLYENIRLKTYVLSKQLLLEYIETYDTLEYRTLADVVKNAPNLKRAIYRHSGYTRTITDAFNFLKSNLDMLSFSIGRQVFREDRPVYSKEKTAPPTKYLSNSYLENAMVSSGSIIDGTLINSVIGRDVMVKKGAIIRNSFIMSNSIIEENAFIDYAILDKQTVVKKNTVITGTLTNPYVSQKEQIITNFDRIRVLIVASESYPFIKTGGLADVTGALARNLGRNGVDVTVILPLYKKIKDDFDESLKRERSRTVIFDGKPHKIKLFSYQYKKVKFYFIESFDFFDQDEIYGSDNDPERFGFFNKAVVDSLDYFHPFDLIHIHDWHTSMIPILLDNSPHKGLKTLLTIHNIDYQGITHNNLITKLGIQDFIFRSDMINMLEIGINTATKLSTVSPTYREELKFEYFGKNLTYSLLTRERDFYGILNGISSKLNPELDKSIHTNYGRDTLELKIENKRFLQEEMGLDVNDDAFVMGMVTRIVEHKGFDLVVHMLERVLKDHPDIQFVLLGTGDEKYVTEMKKIEERYPKQMKLNIGYDATSPNYIYAGADVFLMPSRFEPCGLGQMIALAYGTLPIVRKTGGLNDTVFNYDPLTKKGNGFVFENYDVEEFVHSVFEAYLTYIKDPESFYILKRRAMKVDHSLKKSTQRYIELYRVILEL